MLLYNQCLFFVSDWLLWGCTYEDQLIYCCRMRGFETPTYCAMSQTTPSSAIRWSVLLDMLEESMAAQFYRRERDGRTPLKRGVIFWW